LDQTINQSLGASWRSDLLSQIASLSNPDVNFLTMSTASRYDARQSPESSRLPNPSDYHAAFANAPFFRAAILAKLPAGSGLTPDDILARAPTPTCAGCHHKSGNVNIGGGLTHASAHVHPRATGKS
jgi:hypothetical protein